MKYLWVARDFPPSMGGVQQYAYHYIKNFPNSSCVVLTKINPDFARDVEVDNDLRHYGHRVYRTSYFLDGYYISSMIKNPCKLFLFFLTLLRIVRKEKIHSIVFAHFSFSYYFISFIFKFFLKVKTNAIFHGEDIPIVNMRSNGFLRFLIKKVDRCICNSNFTYKRLRKFLDVDIVKYIAYPGVENKYFSDIEKSKCKNVFDVNEKLVLYTVGRLDERKGHDLVIKCIPEIVKYYAETVYLIGGKGPYLDKLKSLVDQLDLHKYVRFCGYISDEDIRVFHGCGDVFVMPNRILEDGDTEGFGIVFLEAGASGNPVIGGRAGGALDSVVDGVTGYLVDPNGTEEFTTKTLKLLSDRTYAEQLGAAGKKRAYELFRWPVLAPILVNYLKN